MSKAKVIAKEGLYVRADRNRKSEAVRTMVYGEEFDFIEEYRGWLAVEDGWVMLSDAWVEPVEMSCEPGFGENPAVTLVAERDVVLEGSAMGEAVITPDIYEEFVSGQVYNVTIDGNKHEIVAGEVTYGDTIGLEYGSTDAIYNIYTNGSEYNVICTGGSYTMTLSIERPGTITTIDPKFLPEPLQIGEEVTTIVENVEFTVDTLLSEDYNSNGRVSCNIVKPIDAPGVLEQSKEYTVVYNDVTYQCVGINDGYGNVGVGKYSPYELSPEMPFSFAIAYNTADECYQAMVYVLGEIDSSHSFSIYETSLTQLDEKFIPDSIARTADLEALIERVAALESAASA